MTAPYSEKILEHAKHPRRFGRIALPDLQFEEVNPLCGDRIRVELRLSKSGSSIEEAGFSGEMCAIARGSASILFESLEGMAVAAITAITEEQLLGKLGGPVKSTRVKCALLPLAALMGAIRSAER